MYFIAFKFRKSQILTFQKDFEKINFAPINKILDKKSATKFRKSEWTRFHEILQKFFDKIFMKFCKSERTKFWQIFMKFCQNFVHSLLQNFVALFSSKILSIGAKFIFSKSF
jgi:hypothetical protein